MTPVATESGSTATTSVAAVSVASTEVQSSAAVSVASVSTAQSVASVASSTASVASSAAEVKYDLKLPADARVDAAIVERTAAVARAQGLGNEAGQSLLNAVVAEVHAQEAARVEAWKPGGTEWVKRDAQWSADALADPDLAGGDKARLATSIELAQKVRTALGGKEFDTFLKDTGLGSHPAALKFLARIGKSMSESSLIVGRPAASGGTKSHAASLYGPDGTGKTKTQE